MGRRRTRRSRWDFPFAHPFKERFRRLGVRLWELRDMTGVSESRLSRYLNGIDPMPLRLEEMLEKYLEILVRPKDLEAPKRAFPHLGELGLTDEDLYRDTKKSDD